MSVETAVALAALLAVGILFYGIYRVMAGDIDVESRLDQYASRRPRGGREGATGEAGPSAIANSLEKRVQGSDWATGLQAQLSKANIKMTVGEFLIFQVVAVFVGVVVGAIAGGVILALVFAVVGFFVPKFYVKRAMSKRQQMFQNQLGDTITMMANSLRSGYSLLQSMELVSREAPNPTADEFQRVVREVGLGFSAEQALANLVTRIQSEDLDLMVTAINVQSEVGGNLAQILETIGMTIRERVRIKGEVKVLTAQGTMSGYVISFLPVGIALAIYMINRPYIEGVLSGKWLVIPICAGLMIVSGYFTMMKMIEIEV
ncbi:MAG: type II secretion system F family protein [Chloroflexi bacterium]|nr:type II secretion system F family protein [Chloroflexota bacterium]